MSVNYELAKQLKDAGFPQNKEALRCRCSFPAERVEGAEPVYTHSEAYVYVPTLSELIEACGDDFAHLERMEDDVGNTGGWTACEHYGTGAKSGNAKTPDEAVAKLWISLHTK